MGLVAHFQRRRPLRPGGVPNSYRELVSAGGDAAPVRRIRRAEDCAGVSLQNVQQLAVGNVPHLYEPVPAAGDDPLADGGEGNAANELSVAIHLQESLAGFSVPD